MKKFSIPLNGFDLAAKIYGKWMLVLTDDSYSISEYTMLTSAFGDVCQNIQKMLLYR